MTLDEFQESLNKEQRLALLAFRDSLQAMFDGTAKDLEAVYRTQIHVAREAAVAAETQAAESEVALARFTAERDEVRGQLATITTDRDSALEAYSQLDEQYKSALGQLAAAEDHIFRQAELLQEKTRLVESLEAKVAELQAEASPNVPTITPDQLRIWLAEHGQSPTAVKDAIAKIADPVTRRRAEIKWEYAVAIPRDSAFVGLIGAALGLKAEQLDQAFDEAMRY